MDKQKQIEEMSKEMCGGCIENELMTCSFSREEIPCEFAKSFAERLINAGYRKIPENAVVLTREEKQEYESLVKLLIYDKPIKNRVYEFIKDTKQQTRKETAEKFAERLKDLAAERNCNEDYDWKDVQIDGQIFVECVDEICKEITEGVENVSR